MPDCTACGGAWVVDGGACVACCSIAPGMDNFVYEHFGFNPYPEWWDAIADLGAGAIPLHLRAGFDLGARLLGHRLGADVEASCWFGPSENAQTWWLEARTYRTDPQWWCFNPAPLVPDRRVVTVPRISQPPSGLPPRIRAAAAMRLAWEAVKGRLGPPARGTCDECPGGYSFDCHEGHNALADCPNWSPDVKEVSTPTDSGGG